MEDEGDNALEQSNLGPSNNPIKPTKTPPPAPADKLHSPMKSFSRKRQLKRVVSTVTTALRSGLSKSEALMEIDRLQKGILALQTEKEFVKSSYESGLARYWEIENQLTEMQGRVSQLQDEFGIGMVIEDDEARTLMAATALRSCQNSLEQLQTKQEQAAEEAREEYQKIKEAREKFKLLSNESGNKDGDLDQEKYDFELLNCKEKVEVLESDSGSPVSMADLAERIDGAVNKVMSLETLVTSQAALVKRLRAETTELQAQIRSLEERKDDLMNDSGNKMRELEEELIRVGKLNKNVEEQNRYLHLQFVEAKRNLERLSEKLLTVKQGDDPGDGALFHNTKKSEEVEDVAEPLISSDDSIRGGEDASNTSSSAKIKKAGEEEQEEAKRSTVESNPNYLDGFSEEASNEVGEKVEDDQANWMEFMSKGFEERETVLLEEYTAILRDYREAKKKLSETEKKKRDSLFESAMQIRDLRSANALKDEEIRTLRLRLRNSETKSERSADVNTMDSQSLTGLESSSSHPSLFDLLKEPKSVETTPTAMEEKFRGDIDSLQEENLEFWLSFSALHYQIQKFQTSIHDLKGDFLKLIRNSRSATRSSHQTLVKTEARPLYNYLREIENELTLWLEQNTGLKDELRARTLSLESIREEIGRVSGGRARLGAELDEYQAAKFQGELLNMRKENNGVADELRAGFDRVRGLRTETGRLLGKMNEEFGFSAATNHNQKLEPQTSRRSTIPLRSFLFGVKQKHHHHHYYHKQPSIFSCLNPALQKQYSGLGRGLPP